MPSASTGGASTPPTETRSSCGCARLAPCDLRNARLAELTADPAAPVLPHPRPHDRPHQPADGLPRGCLIVNAITERTADPATRDLAHGRS